MNAAELKLTSYVPCVTITHMLCWFIKAYYNIHNVIIYNTVLSHVYGHVPSIHKVKALRVGHNCSGVHFCNQRTRFTQN